jgi:hypothetical protein
MRRSSAKGKPIWALVGGFGAWNRDGSAYGSVLSKTVYVPASRSRPMQPSLERVHAAGAGARRIVC